MDEASQDRLANQSTASNIELELVAKTQCLAIQFESTSLSNQSNSIVNIDCQFGNCLVELTRMYLAAFRHHLKLPHCSPTLSARPTSVHLLLKHPQLHRHVWISIMLDHVSRFLL